MYKRRVVRSALVGAAMLVVAALSYVAPIGPGSPAPAAAWGHTPKGAVGCGASGSSGRWFDWIGLTYGTNCGFQMVRFRSWGFSGPWRVGDLSQNALVSSPSEFPWGGADHRACLTCPTVMT